MWSVVRNYLLRHHINTLHYKKKQDTNLTLYNIETKKYIFVSITLLELPIEH